MARSFVSMRPEVETLVDRRSSISTSTSETTWLSFSGDESVAEFIQSVQKYAYERGRSTDDWWIAGYVVNCFSGDAMLWYCNLDEKTRNTWTRLRKALAARYGKKPQPKSFSSVQAERLRDVQATIPEKEPGELRGHVEVFVPETKLWLGFLGYSFGAKEADLSISGNKSGAALVSLIYKPKGEPEAEPKGKPERKLVQLRIRNAPSDVYFPYIGLAMDDPVLKAQTSGPSLSTVQAVDSRGQEMSKPDAPSKSATREWSLRACTESNPDDNSHRAAKTACLWEKASDAVWVYDVNEGELGAAWVNDSECSKIQTKWQHKCYGEQLAIFVNKPTSRLEKVNVILHSEQDKPGQADKIPVKLFFVEN